MVRNTLEEIGKIAFIVAVCIMLAFVLEAAPTGDKRPTKTVEQVDAMHSNATYTGPACGYSTKIDKDSKTITVTMPKGWTLVHNPCE